MNKYYALSIELHLIFSGFFFFCHEISKIVGEVFLLDMSGLFLKITFVKPLWGHSTDKT